MAGKKKILLITRGGKGYGLGHVLRALAVGKALAASSDVTLIAMGDASCASCLKNPGPGIDVKTFRDDRGLFLHAEKTGFFHSVIIDMLYTPVSFIDRMKKICGRMMIFDDMARCKRGGGNIVIVRPQETCLWSGGKQGSGAVIKGADLFPLRPEFMFYREIKKFSSDVDDILISLGGAARRKDLDLITGILDRAIPGDINLHIAGGYTGSGRKTVQGRRITFYDGSINMAEIITRVDLGIIAGGFIKFEFMCIGTPFCMLALNEHQRVLSERFSKKGFGIALGRFGDISGHRERFPEKVSGFIADKDKRKEMFLRSRKLVDGRGIVRILKSLV